tara:strand:- start:21194 stop:22183 length:990 start_codon:yes stop_codon:yes gene_type:complete
MEKKNINQIKKFIKRFNFSDIKKIRTIRSGKNSKVYKINIDKKIIVLKSYYGDKKQRIKKEFQFYKYLNQLKIKNVVTPLFFDFKNNFVILPYITGNKIQKINDKHITQFSNFINKINQKKVGSKKIKLAVEGINNRKDYITICNNRIKKLKTVNKKSLINRKFHSFLNKKIIPKFETIKNELNKKKIFHDISHKLNKKDMIISPSDFGFHNAIESKKKIFFFDFEYAGYDDPVKLICDFYCQPNQKVSHKQKEKFKKLIIRKYKTHKKLDYLISQLLPLHYLKWCCIILNEFIIAKSLIRNHAGHLKNDTLQSQLIKANNYFNRYLKV